jgi:hypothetical protein
MVQPQTYKPDYDIVSYAPFDEPSNFDRVIEAIGGIAPGDIILSVPNDDGSGFVERRFPCREALQRRLKSAARAYEPNLWGVRRPTPNQRLDWLRQTRSLMDRTIANLRSTAASEEALEPARFIWLLDVQMQVSAGATILDGEPTVAELAATRVLNDLSLLRDWFDHAITISQEDQKTAEDVPAHQGDVALDQLVESLLVIWRDVLNRRIGTSVGCETSPQRNKAGGPLIRFLSMAVPIATEGKATPTNEALRMRVERIRKRWKDA